MPNNSRHAYCIIAHNNPIVLNNLISMIDDVRNDIFIMIDDKSDISGFGELHTACSKVYFCPGMSIYWGGVSQIKAELKCLDLAVSIGTYSRFHLLSGVDLPLKNQDYMHFYFDELHPYKEFIGLSSFDAPHEQIIGERTNYYYLFQNRNVPLLLFMNDFFLGIQKKFNFKRRPKQLTLRMGPNWCSITQELVRYILSKKEWILSTFKHTLCCDELYKQTLVYNSGFKDRVYNLNDEYDSCKRAIAWNQGRPHVWEVNDAPVLLASNALFARKFSDDNVEEIALIIRSSQSYNQQVGDHGISNDV